MISDTIVCPTVSKRRWTSCLQGGSPSSARRALKHPSMFSTGGALSCVPSLTSSCLSQLPRQDHCCSGSNRVPVQCTPTKEVMFLLPKALPCSGDYLMLIARGEYFSFNEFSKILFKFSAVEDLCKLMRPRTHASLLVFHNDNHIATYSNKPQTPFASAIMPTRRRRQNQDNSSSGEEFSDVSPTVNTDDESVTQPQDNWTFPVVSSKAKREEYETASKFFLMFIAYFY